MPFTDLLTTYDTQAHQQQTEEAASSTIVPPQEHFSSMKVPVQPPDPSRQLFGLIFPTKDIWCALCLCNGWDLIATCPLGLHHSPPITLLSRLHPNFDLWARLPCEPQPVIPWLSLHLGFRSALVTLRPKWASSLRARTSLLMLWGLHHRYNLLVTANHHQLHEANIRQPGLV